MNRDDITRMAREAGFVNLSDQYWDCTTEGIERFAALVAAAERDFRWTQDHWTEYELSIVAVEREACAQMADKWIGCDGLAAAIRARGEQ